MVTAQWLVDGVRNGNTVQYSVFAPAMGPGFAVRDEQHRIKGALALEAYIINGNVVV
jgi:hypothetical protein